MEKIWEKNYPPDVAFTINPDAYSSVSELLEETFQKYAHQPAFENFGVQLSYQELQNKVQHFAAYLQKVLKLQKGDRIAIMLPNCLQYPLVLLAALRLGLVIVNINPLYTERELTIPLKDSGAKAIVVLTNFAASLSHIISETQLEHVIVTDLGDLLTPLKGWMINFVLRYIKKAIPPFNLLRKLSFKNALHAGSKLTLDPVHIESSDTAFLQYTGGTTGVPKGAMLTHRNMISNILQSAGWIGHVLTEGKEVIVTALPLYHIFSLTVCCFTFIKLGCKGLLITNPRDFKGFIKELCKQKFTIFVGVNTLFEALLRQPGFDKIEWSNTNLVLAGGMAVLKSTAEKWQAATNMPIIMGYGLTEASPVVSINPLSLTKFNASIGLPITATNVEIRDDANKSVSLGSAGELCVQGPQVMKGYWNNEKETKETLSDDGWLKTGDIALMDDQGYIYLIDRKKDMILISGFNVYPIEVEEIIASHPGVEEVAVIGVPDTQSGESVKAFIVKKDPELTEEDIRALCKEKLTGYKRPSLIEFCSDLPKSNVGKILKQKLRAKQSIG
ncbi:MAG: AMP-binding protein [Gammaproteobacteria bacterium]|nr:AMP-binding protein [Gammaproteobacteria bacterium]